MTMGTDRTEPEVSSVPPERPAGHPPDTESEPVQRARGPRRASRPATGFSELEAADEAGRVAHARQARPDVSVDDTDQGWGEAGAHPSRDQWMREQRPPHWGRD